MPSESNLESDEDSIKERLAEIEDEIAISRSAEKKKILREEQEELEERLRK